MRYELAIIGSGSAAFAAAITARDAGASVMMIERSTIGGAAEGLLIDAEQAADIARAEFHGSVRRLQLARGLATVALDGSLKK